MFFEDTGILYEQADQDGLSEIVNTVNCKLKNNLKLNLEKIQYTKFGNYGTLVSRFALHHS